MAFRDDTEALRARIQVLERELETLRDARVDRDRLKARVDELERELGIKRERQERAQREAERARAQRSEHLRRKVRPILPKVLALLAVGAGIFVFVRFSGCFGPSRDAAPSLGLVDLDATPEPALPSMSTRGTSATPGDCRGYVPDAPQLVLRSSGPEWVRIAPEAVSGDLVLLVIDAEGRVHCDDDGGGSRNPLVTAVLPPGDARVWVGTYGVGESIDFSLGITSRPAPASANTPSLGAMDGPSEDHRLFQGLVLPVNAASELESSCRGYLANEPQLTLRLARESAVRLHASAPTDLVMLLREPDGTILCDDDSGHGNEPLLATLLPAGEHHVWVGTYSRNDHPVGFTLDASAHALDPQAAPELGERALRGGEVVRFEGVSREEVSPRALGASCGGGLVGARPHAAVSVAESHDVIFELASESAPFAVIEHPGRAFECVSSGRGRHLWGPGVHRVYVGVQQESTPAAFTLSLRAEPTSVRPWTP